MDLVRVQRKRRIRKVYLRCERGWSKTLENKEADVFGASMCGAPWVRGLWLKMRLDKLVEAVRTWRPC